MDQLDFTHRTLKADVLVPDITDTEIKALLKQVFDDEDVTHDDRVLLKAAWRMFAKKHNLLIET